MDSITLFSFGYWGWGNCTDKLVEAVDAVERSRGQDAPMFVDIRVSRSVRAVGFNGRRFENLLGADRYIWMNSLGNQTPQGPGISIKDPSEAEALLDLACELAERRRRVIFFCACEFPGVVGEWGECHRATVADLLLKEARKRRRRISVVEWPGGEPDNMTMPYDSKPFKKLKSRRSIPLMDGFSLADFAAIPWGTTATIHSDVGAITRVVGPARFVSRAWCLPVIDLEDESVGQWRQRNGFNIRNSK